MRVWVRRRRRREGGRGVRGVLGGWREGEAGSRVGLPVVKAVVHLLHLCAGGAGGADGAGGASGRVLRLRPGLRYVYLACRFLPLACLVGSKAAERQTTSAPVAVLVPLIKYKSKRQFHYSLFIIHYSLIIPNP